LVGVPEPLLPPVPALVTHVPALHVKPEAQSVPEAQREAHVPLVQRYGEQGTTWPLGPCASKASAQVPAAVAHFPVAVSQTAPCAQSAVELHVCLQSPLVASHA
jgi:hypothetical protein